MAVIALALYGSRARQDAAADADVDLVAVTTDSEATTSVHEKLILSSYPLSQILARAAIGDLFALHLATEAHVLYEAGPVFEQIRRAFIYKADYAREIQLASEVGWFLVRHGDRFRDAKHVNERMAWCARTVVIARAANERRAIFSAQQLAEFAGSVDLRTIIDNKNNADRAPDVAALLATFLARLGSEEPPARSLDEEEAAFAAARNEMGLREVRALRRSPRDSPVR